MRSLLLLAACAATVLSAQSLSDSITSILNADSARRTVWAIHVVDTADGKELFSHHGDQPMTPASNTKLFSTAMALSVLGPEARLETTVMADAAPDAAGAVRGDLRLVGGGDPSLSGRIYPFNKDAKPGDPLSALDELALQLTAAGVREVRGDIVGDDTRYAWTPYPDGWTVDDGTWEYGAPVSALTFNDNIIRLSTYAPESATAGPTLVVSPELEYFTIQNQIRIQSGVQTRLQYDRAPGSRVLQIHGVMAPRGQAAGEELAVDDPALFAAEAFRLVLQRRGITVRGQARAAHRGEDDPYQPLTGVTLARRASPPIAQLITAVDKESQNLHAELMLLAASRDNNGAANRADALKAEQQFLTAAGIPESAYGFADGSGLSRRTLVAPVAITRLLTFMAQSPNREVYRDALPIAGVDGTLEHRFAKSGDVTMIRAKTGSLSHVSALSGYIDQPSGRRLAFSIIANHSLEPASVIRPIIDKIAVAILKQAGE